MMTLNFLYIILAALGLGLLIFIHELGHYWVARRQGMTVEAFSIGFGKPIYSWERNGVKWQICWIPFGGFVRIAGMEKKGTQEPYEIPDGFFGKPPTARIKVALAGPIVNILFAFFAFCLLWVFGGRNKPFSEYTRLIGWVEPASAIYTEAGVRPGDQITELNHKSFRNFQGFIYSAIFDDKAPLVDGRKIDYFNGQHIPFEYQYSFPKKSPITERIYSVLGTIQPASYLIYRQSTSIPLDENSPMRNSGIEDGDRILWADGELMFSTRNLIETINEPKALLTIQRGQETFLVRAPRLKISDLRLDNGQKAELSDWQHEAQIKGRLADLFFIPYSLTPSCQVEGPYSFLNNEMIEQQPTAADRSATEVPLQPGDTIIAVDGLPVSSAYEMISLLQARHIQIIVKKDNRSNIVSWKEADAAFVADIDFKALQRMIQSIGTQSPLRESGNLKMLAPAAPKPLSQMTISEEKRAQMEQVEAAQLKEIEKIQNPKEKAEALQLLELETNRLKLGIALADRPVNYNPSPFILFGNVFQETYKTIIALFSGNVSPKYMTGPVGIVHVMQQSWGHGFKEALYWLGMISLNLGVLNLLPIPVLDGGHICFSLWEMITGRRLKAKTMERLIIPFVVLLVALFVFLTYHDLVRLFSGFIK